VFSQYKDMPVLTQCATCHRTLAREYAGDGKELAGRIVDSALFLSRNSAFSGIGLPDSALLDALGLPSRKGRPVTESDPLIVTVHDPCHLRLDPDAGRAVRSMLASNPLIKLIELSEPGICCGGGGVSSLKNPALADELGEARAQAVMKTGADVVVSQCPGCVLQLNNHLKRLNAVQRARHALEIITLHI
ncbi:MAG: (Fe-S)-binding protein, partial [Mailhella sp.]|nr:(Fe-S)-binding protein [Mailhella sp.]